MSRVEETSDTVKRLGKGLKAFSKCVTIKADFLLFSLPTPFYSNKIENTRAKDYTYELVVQKPTE